MRNKKNALISNGPQNYRFNNIVVTVRSSTIEYTNIIIEIIKINNNSNLLMRKDHFSMVQEPT